MFKLLAVTDFTEQLSCFSITMTARSPQKLSEWSHLSNNSADDLVDFTSFLHVDFNVSCFAGLGNMNSFLNSKDSLTHCCQRCQSKTKPIRPRYPHQSTLNLGKTAPCYITTHDQVSPDQVIWMLSQTFVNVCKLLFCNKDQLLCDEWSAFFFKIQRTWSLHS